MIRMLVLRYAALLALVVWVGGLVALGGIAAPAIFAVVAERQIADGRILSGALFGEMLARFTVVSYFAAGVVLLTLIVRRILGPRPHRFAWRAGIGALMLAATVYGSLGVAARITRLQREIGVAPSTLPEGDARRAEFGRLHGLSTALQLVPLLGGLLLIFWEIKD
jgi:Domain of unknown function (DUF4149)